MLIGTGLACDLDWYTSHSRKHAVNKNTRRQSTMYKLNVCVGLMTCLVSFSYGALLPCQLELNFGSRVCFAAQVRVFEGT